MSASFPAAVARVPEGRCDDRRVSFGALVPVVVALRALGEGAVVVLWAAQPARLSAASAGSRESVQASRHTLTVGAVARKHGDLTWRG